MTTPQWAIDDDGRLVYPLPDRDGVEARAIYIGPGTFAVLWPDRPGEGESHEAVAALVADVTAARLVDDMAAVVIRLDGRWEIFVEPQNQQHWSWWRNLDTNDLERMSPGEVAALHHARRQEETP